MKRATLVLASLALLLGGVGQARAGFTVGSDTAENCYPFSCAAGDGVIEYQEVYSSSAFSGPLGITELSYFAAPGSLGQPIDDATYTISLSATSGNVGALSNTPSVNLGADNTAFGTYHLSGTMPQQLNLYGNTFNYDPSKGNLLVDVKISLDNGTGQYKSYFEADGTTSSISRLYAYNNGQVGQGGGALVTEFNANPIAAVPEPSTLTLLGIGVVGLIGYGWRRRKQAVPA